MPRYIKSETPRRVFLHTKEGRPSAPLKTLPPPLLDEDNKVVLKPEILVGSLRFRKYYVLHSKQKKKLGLYRIGQIIKKFFRELRNRMMDTEAGAFIEKLGYFFVMKSPTRKVSPLGGRIHSLGKYHIPMFVPIRKDSKTKSFTMDGGFIKTVYNAMYYRVTRKRKNYKMMLTIIQNLYGRENLKAVTPNKKKIDNNK